MEKIHDFDSHKTLLQANLNRSQRSLVTKFKSGVLPLRIETGRFKGVKRELRYCELCNSKQVEDEIHMLFHCEKLKVVRFGFELYDKNAKDPYSEVANWLKPDNIKLFASWLERMMYERRKIMYGY